MAVSIVDLYVEPETGAMLTIWRAEINASSTVTLTVDPAMAGLEAVAYENASGPDLGRVDITVPDDATTGAYTWSAEIDGDVVWVGQIFIEQNARNTSYVAHSPDIRSLTEPPFIIYRSEDIGAPDTGGAATQLIEIGGPTTLDMGAVADGEYLRRVGDEVVGGTPGGGGDVTAALAFGTDNRLIRSDGTGKGVQASTASLTDTGALSGITDLTITGDLVMSASKTVDGVDVSALATTVGTKLGGSTGANDERVLRSDGTGGNTVQASTVTLSDAGAIGGVTDLTLTGDVVMSTGKLVDGRDISDDWATTAAHIADTANPHETTFVLLGDAPAAYTGEGGKVVKVKVDETGLEFVNGGAGVDSFTDLDDAPASYTGAALQVVRVKNDETGLEFATVSGTGDVVGPGSSVDNTIVRFDGVSGKAVQGTGIVVDDTNSVSGVVDLTMTGNITLSTAGATVDGIDLTAQATTIAGKLGGSTGATDNRVLRADGTGGLTAQSSAATLDDSGNLSGIGNITLSGTVDGRDVSSDGTALDSHTANTSNPHDVQFIQLIDAPVAYTGAAGKVVTVNGTEDGLEFTTPSTATGDVVGPASSTDEAFARWDSTTGKLLMNGPVKCTDTGVVTGIDDMTIGGSISMSALETVDGRDVSVDGAALDALAAVAVTASGAFATDERLLRSDGTGRGAQASAIAVTDAGAVSGITTLSITDNLSMASGKTVDGRDVSVDGTALDALVSASTTYVTAASTFGTDERILRSDGTGRGSQASTLALTDAGALSGITDLTLTGDITMSASKTVDGRDISADWTTSSAHFSNTSNPHSVTAAQAGAIATSAKGAASGVASLDANTRLVEAAQVLRVTGQDLTAGAVTDGQYVIRSGTTYAGITPDLDTWVPGTATASQIPRRNSGNSAFEWATITAADVSAIATSAKGAASGVASLDSNTRLVEAAQVIRVTGQDLTVGAVSDGQMVVRSGTTLIGAAAATNTRQVAVLTSDFSTSGSGASVTGWSSLFTITAGKTYKIELVAQHQAAANTTVAQLALDWSQAPQMLQWMVDTAHNTAATSFSSASVAADNTYGNTSANVSNATTNYFMGVRGTFKAHASTGGTITVNMRSSDGTTSATLKAGSYFLIDQLD